MKHQILIADDDPVSRGLLGHLLRRSGHLVREVDDGASAWKELSGPEPPRIAVLDWMMPGLDGPEICRRVRAAARADRYTYLLLLTGLQGTRNLVTGLESGADDYLAKPVHPDELAARLQVAARILDLEDRLHDARREVEIQARCDALTGLANRRAVVDVLASEDREPYRDLALVLSDLDHFKSINDTWGHPAGDAVLVEVARRLKAVVRSGDIAGRYGGEEFLVVLPGAPESVARTIAGRLRRSVEAEPVRWAEERIPVTLSVGVAWRPAASAESSQALLQRTDQALYVAKRFGRNRVVSAERTMLSEAVH